MPDDLSKKGPADRSKISFKEPHEVQFWADKLATWRSGPEGGSLRGGGRKGIEGQPRLAVVGAPLGLVASIAQPRAVTLRGAG
jgi:hypothetical protein